MYWFGIGLELLSACLVAEVCQASRVFLMRKEPLSMTLELSLFTAIPVDKACNYISSKLLKDDKLSSRTSLDSNEIILLLHLSNNYFIYDHKIYNQIHGCAMGSPVSPVVGNLCMEVIEEVEYGNAMGMTASASSKRMLLIPFILHLIPSTQTSHSLLSRNLTNRSLS